MERKICIYSVNIVAQVIRDNKVIDKIKFAEMIEANGFTEAFDEVQRRIKIRARCRGYRLNNGYRLQYEILSPFKKIWEGISRR